MAAFTVTAGAGAISLRIPLRNRSKAECAGTAGNGAESKETKMHDRNRIDV